MLHNLKYTLLFSGARRFARLLAAFLVFQQLPALPGNTQAEGAANLDSHFEPFILPGGALGNSVNCIVQDSIGFLWFGSQGGLHRYDGSHFETYLHAPDGPLSLSYSYIEWICLAGDTGLWVGTYGGGLNFFDPFTETAVRYQHDPEDPHSLSNDFVNMVAIGPDGMVWVGTNDGLNRLNPATGNFKRFRHSPDNPASLSYDLVRAVYFDRQGTLWVGTGSPWSTARGGLNRYEPSTGAFTRYLHDPLDEHSLRDHRVRAILEDSKGNFWVGAAGNTLHLMDRERGTFTALGRNAFGEAFAPMPQHPPAQPVGQHLSFIFEDQSQRIWIGSVSGGINLYDPVTGHLHHFEHEDSNPFSPSNNFVWHMCQTADGALWLATAGGGRAVDKVAAEKKLFDYIDLGSLNTYGYPGLVTDLEAAGNDTLWIGTENGGLIRYILSTGKWEQFPQLGGVSRMARDEKGIIWVLEPGSETKRGTFQLTRFGPKTGAIHEFRKEGLSTPLDIGEVGYDYRDLVVGQAGKLWAPYSGGGLICFDTETESFTHFVHKTGNPNTLPNDAVLNVYPGKDGKIWIGGGLFAYSDSEETACFIASYDPNTGIFKQYELPEETRHSAVFSIVQDFRGKIWFSVIDFGIGRLDPSDGSVSFFNYYNGKLPTYNNAYELQAGRDSQLWFLFQNSIMRFNPETESYTEYNPAKKGEIVIYRNKSTQNHEGRLFWAVRDGIYSLSPAKLGKGERTPPKVMITDFLLQDKRQLPGADGPLTAPIWSTENIRISHGNQSFTFRFACLDFRDPDANHFEFMLEPYDPFWRQPQGAHSATYVNVPPGHYTFHLKAANREGIWGTEKSIRVVIFPPWWARWWAYSIYILAAAGILYAFFRFRLNRELERAEAYRLKELDAVKTRLYTNISHEFRTPLTIISGMARQIEEEPEKWFREGLRMIRDNSNKVLYLVDQMLGLQKLEAGKMPVQFQQGDVLPCLRYLTRAFGAYAATQGVHLHFLPAREEIVMDYDPEKLAAILSNLLSNAIKFTPEGGNVYVQTGLVPSPPGVEEKSTEALLLQVKDTGIGIPKDKLPYIFSRFYQVEDSATRQRGGTGIGLAIIQEMVNLLEGKASVKSREGEGSEFSVWLPVTRKAPPAVSAAAEGLAGQVGALVSPVQTSGLTKTEATEATRKAPLALIIDDQEDILSYLKVLLAGSYQLATARDGEEGRNKAIELIPDIIISDVMMPKMDGIELCATLRADERTSHIPIILLTAKADVASRIEGLEQGADAYLAKPFDKEELLVRMRKLLELRDTLRKSYLAAAGIGVEKGLPEPKELPPREDAFVRKVRQAVMDHLDDFELNVQSLCRELHLSTSQLQRKLNALTGLTPVKFIRHLRLNQARALLKDPNRSVTSIAFDTGFNDPDYFSRVFRQEFGQTPTEYREGETTSNSQDTELT